MQTSLIHVMSMQLLCTRLKFKRATAICQDHMKATSFQRPWFKLQTAWEISQIFLWQDTFILIEEFCRFKSTCDCQTPSSRYHKHTTASKVSRVLLRHYDLGDVPRIYTHQLKHVDHIFFKFFHTMDSSAVQRVAAIASSLFLLMICDRHDDLETTDGATCLLLFIGRTAKNHHEHGSFITGGSRKSLARLSQLQTLSLYRSRESSRN